MHGIVRTGCCVNMEGRWPWPLSRLKLLATHLRGVGLAALLAALAAAVYVKLRPDWYAVQSNPLHLSTQRDPTGGRIRQGRHVGFDVIMI